MLEHALSLGPTQLLQTKFPVWAERYTLLFIIKDNLIRIYLGNEICFLDSNSQVVEGQSY